MLYVNYALMKKETYNNQTKAKEMEIQKRMKYSSCFLQFLNSMTFILLKSYDNPE